MTGRHGEVGVFKLALGALAIIAFATGALVVLPYFTLHGVEAPAGLDAGDGERRQPFFAFVGRGAAFDAGATLAQRFDDPPHRPALERGVAD